jgi:hypothetical protein
MRTAVPEDIKRRVEEAAVEFVIDVERREGRTSAIVSEREHYDIRSVNPETGEVRIIEVKVLAGSGSIGGNFVRLEDGDRVLVLDQGIRFDVMSRRWSTRSRNVKNMSIVWFSIETESLQVRKFKEWSLCEQSLLKTA